MGDEQGSPWTMLRHHWNDAAKRERENPPPDRPPYEFVFEHGSADMEAAPASGCYAIEPGSTGVKYVTSWGYGRWMAHEAGDLWPCKPTQWWPLKAWPATNNDKTDG